jgi:uncharacterized protein (DUF2141 family)
VRAGRRHGLGLMFTACLWACADPPTSVQTDAALSPDAAPIERGFTLEVAFDSASPTVSGRLHLLAEPLDGPGQHIIDLAETTGETTTFEIDALDPGHWRLTVFVDQDRDGHFDDCPYPATPNSPLIADTLDNHHARWTGTLAAGSTVTLTLERRLCGPGDATTGLSGTVILPDGIDAAPVPILLALDPVDHEAPALRLPLFPAGLDTQRTAFSIGELLAGAYRLTVFSDDDNDGHPSPCGPALGGGDRFAASYPEGGGGIVIEAGRRLPVELPLNLAAGCPDALTGLELDVALDAHLTEALIADRSLDDGTGVLAGPIWLGLIPPEGGPPVQTTQLFDAVAALPGARTITGLEPGLWSIAAWVDRDGDGQFGPCGGLAGGLDAVSGRADTVQIADGLVRALRIELRQGDCDLELGGLQGDLRVPLEAGPVGSGRAVRLDLFDEVREDRLSVQLFEDHWRMPDTEGPEQLGRFARTAELPPGTYATVAYLDTDRDGRYTPCDPVTGFGDRASSQPGDAAEPNFETLQIAPGHLAELGTVTLRDLACPIPDTTIAPTIVVLGGRDEPAAALRLHIEEAGGWTDDLPLSDALTPLPGVEFTVPRRALPPGRYRLTAYLDTDDDQTLDPCESDPFDAWVGRIEIELSEQTPNQSPILTLEPACGR